MFRKVTLFTLIVALIVIILGSSLRFSNAVQGCPDWPGCYGQAIVSSNADFLDKAKSLFPSENIHIVNAKKVMMHRYASALLGISLVFLTLFAFFRQQARWAVVSANIILLLLFCSQTALGVWVLSPKTLPIILVGNLLLGFLGFWLLFWVYLRTHSAGYTLHQQSEGPKKLARFAMLILFVQVFLGNWVSTNAAALACTGFPQCNGLWMPLVDYIGAFDLFSNSGKGYAGLLSYDGKVAANWSHRVGAIVCFVILTWVMLKATVGYRPKLVRRSGIFLSVLLLIQLIIGIVGTNLQMPTVFSNAHNVLAALLMLPLIAISFYSKYAFVEDLAQEDQRSVTDTVAEISLGIEEVYTEPTAESLYLRLKTQLQKTRTGLSGVLASIPIGQKEINADLLEQIEASLIMADLGVEVTTDIISQLTESLEKHQLNDGVALEAKLKQILMEILQPCCSVLKIPEQESPFVILVVGINGVGKTTTIGKLAKRLQVQGHSVMLAAGDTFRAAAVEQLEVWGQRNNIQVVAQHTGADSASVIFDAVQSAQAKGIDVLIADTAGRLHTKSNLMDELKKIKRIMSKLDESAPHEVLLVLDAGTGQNALSQTKTFNEFVELTGLAVTKLDGTAKGGVMFALAREFGLPIRFIGVGEGIDDLQDFDNQAFVDALFVKE